MSTRSPKPKLKLPMPASGPSLSQLIRHKFDNDPVQLEAWWVKYATVRRCKLLRLCEIQRDRCAVCHRLTWTPPETGAKSHQATLEHVIPRSLGGTDHWDNLVMTCSDCNTRRGSIDLTVFHDHFWSTGNRKVVRLPPRPAKDPAVGLDRRMSTVSGLAILFHLAPELYNWALMQWDAYVQEGKLKKGNNTLCSDIAGVSELP